MPSSQDRTSSRRASRKAATGPASKPGRAAKPKPAAQRKPAAKRKPTARPRPAAKPADKRRIETDLHALYQRAVQSPDVEMAFVDRVYRKLRGKPATRLREDFCGTAFSSCEWVRRRRTNTAVGLDLHGPTLKWGITHNLSKLTAEQVSRLTLLQRNVLTPGKEAGNMDCILAMNFSYWCFKDRPTLLRYFKTVLESLAPGGLFFMDTYGGWECGMPQKEPRRIAGDRKTAGFKYIWEQASFDPLTSDLVCHIHFKLASGRTINKAFTYKWRLWTMPEIRELLAEAGFKTSSIYWEGDDGNGGGNGVYRTARHAEACASWVSYIVAER